MRGCCFFLLAIKEMAVQGTGGLGVVLKMGRRGLMLRLVEFINGGELAPPLSTAPAATPRRAAACGAAPSTSRPVCHCGGPPLVIPAGIPVLLCSKWFVPAAGEVAGDGIQPSVEKKTLEDSMAF
jgi:hypothetical protein